MKLILFRILLLLFIVFINRSILKAQTDKSESTNNSVFKAKLSFLSNSVYNGRKDSLEVPYVNLNLKYLNTNGFYIGSGLSYLVSSYAQRIDVVNINAGYFKELNDHFDFAVNASKSFYNTNSVSVSSEILGNLGADVTYTNSLFDLSAGSSVSFTTGKSDVSFNFDLSHSFSLDQDDEWSLEPEITSNIGTRNYYGGYLKTRQTKKGKKKITTGTTTTTGNVTTAIVTTVQALNTTQIGLLDYEISLPLYYRGKKWGFFFIPTYAIPQSPITYETTVKTTITTNGIAVSNTKKSTALESIGNIFYGEIGVTLKF